MIKRPMQICDLKSGKFALFSDKEHNSEKAIKDNGKDPHFYGHINRYLKNKRAAIDVGANMGLHTVPLSSIFSSVFAFEPIKELFDIARINLILNQCEHKVSIHNLACGKVNENRFMSGYSGDGHFTCDIETTDNCGGCHITNKPNGRKVEVVNLDSFITQRDIDFIKIDVEGFEWEVLQGCENIIRESLPLVIVEVKDAHLNNIREFFNKFNYKEKIIGVQRQDLNDIIYYQE